MSRLATGVRLKRPAAVPVLALELGIELPVVGSAGGQVVAGDEAAEVWVAVRVGVTVGVAEWVGDYCRGHEAECEDTASDHAECVCVCVNMGG